MAEHNNLYQRAIYYDVIFDRDVSREVEFLKAVYRQIVGRELQSVLDLACGPGYHARAFGKQGYRSVGLDLRPEMIEFAKDRADEVGAVVDWVAADMTNFRLDEPVDFAFCMFDSMDCLTANEQIINHFRAMSDNLTPHGLYLVDLNHPATCSITVYDPFCYAGQRDGISAEIRWADTPPTIDMVAGVAHTMLEMRVKDHGKELVITDQAQERLLTPPELQLLADLSGTLEVVGWYGDFDLSQPFSSSPASRRMIVIFQKRSQ
ncbi:MAG: class I SAM-dependent methyltransferase [Chloroflexi bacterium]|nr:class I SAM-dependent methyltransferase [Chloroflexota bacterium]